MALHCFLPSLFPRIHDQILPVSQTGCFPSLMMHKYCLVLQPSLNLLTNGAQDRNAWYAPAADFELSVHCRSDDPLLIRYHALRASHTRLLQLVQYWSLHYFETSINNAACRNADIKLENQLVCHVLTLNWTKLHASEVRRCCNLGGTKLYITEL